MENPGGKDENSVELLTSTLNGKLVISLNDEAWEEEREEVSNTIAVRLMSGKSFNRAELKTTLLKVWKCQGRIQFLDLPKNIIAASFEKKEEMESVLKSGPWNFMGSPILMQKWKPGLSAEEMEINNLLIWVQFHNLPMGLMKKKKKQRIREIAGVIGEVVEISEVEADLMRMRYARVRINIDVRKPTVDGFFLERKELEPLWVDIRYERVNICSSCRLIGHDATKCSVTRTAMGVSIPEYMQVENSPEDHRLSLVRSANPQESESTEIHATVKQRIGEATGEDGRRVQKTAEDRGTSVGRREVAIDPQEVWKDRQAQSLEIGNINCVRGDCSGMEKDDVIINTKGKKILGDCSNSTSGTFIGPSIQLGYCMNKNNRGVITSPAKKSQTTKLRKLGGCSFKKRKKEGAVLENLERLLESGGLVEVKVSGDSVTNFDEDIRAAETEDRSRRAP